MDTKDVIADLQEVVPRVKPGYITLSGFGEPTLSLNIGRLIRKIKELTSTPTSWFLLWTQPASRYSRGQAAPVQGFA
ncbi:MAG TPA: hypothetical protein P5290_07950 [Candidatus Methanomethylicus sp.]|nr:hypothetical protein [Candidatus Methanomethylicus sp.]